MSPQHTRKMQQCPNLIKMLNTYSLNRRLEKSRKGKEKKRYQMMPSDCHDDMRDDIWQT